MFQKSEKAGKLWYKILDQVREKDEEEIHDALDEAGELSGFESSDSAGKLLEDFFPDKVENITYFFDPGDGAYGYVSTLSESDLIAAMKKVATKYKLKA